MFLFSKTRFIVLFFSFILVAFSVFSLYSQTLDLKISKETDKNSNDDLELKNDAYYKKLVLRADEQGLAEASTWRALLHYPLRKGTTPSEADDVGNFFLAKADGKINVATELRANLLAFLKPANLFQKNKHPQCIFPARFRWLDKKLGFDYKRMPRIKCPALEFWFKILDYESVSIVFASYFLNSPGSALGHTLFKINSKRFKGHDLLSYSINYAATVNDVDALRYVLYGLFGGFPGKFSVLPYHAKVKEYNDIEERDIWEYKIKLSDEEIKTMLYHVWELDQTHFDYYFMKENCSYHLLSLFEVARPSLDLRSEYKIITLPAETLKQLIAKDLLEPAKYRPAINTVLAQRVSQLGAKEKIIFSAILDEHQKLSQTDFSQLKEERQIFLLDTILAIFRAKIEYSAKSKEKVKEEKFYDLLLKERIKLPPTKEKFQIKKEISSPDFSHDPSTLKFSGGVSDFGNFASFRFHPMLHELISVDTAYPLDSELLVFSWDLRFYEDQNKLSLHRFNLLKIISLVPYDFYTEAISYDYSVTIDSDFFYKEEEAREAKGASSNTNDSTTIIDDELRHRNILELAAQGGYSYSLANETRTMFSFLVGGLYHYIPNRLTGEHLFAPSLSAIFLSGVNKWRALFQVKYIAFSALASVKDELQLKLALRYEIAKNREFWLEVNNRKNYRETLFSYLIHF